MTNTIQLQLVNGYFFPVDAVSRQTLIDELELERFPRHRFDINSPILVKRGYKLMVVGYEPQETSFIQPFGGKVGGTIRPAKYNPCNKCYLNMVCDKDICSRKYRR